MSPNGTSEHSNANHVTHNVWCTLSYCGGQRVRSRCTIGLVLPPRILVARPLIANVMKVRYLPEVERNMTPAVAALTINLIRRKYCGWCRATSTRCVYPNLLVLSACRGKHVIQSIQAALWVKPKPPGDYQLPELSLLWGVAHRRHSKWAGKLDKCGRRTQRFHRSATYRAVLSMRIRGLTIEWTSIRKTFSATPNDTKTYSVVQKCCLLYTSPSPRD